MSSYFISRYQQALVLYPPVNPAACMADRSFNIVNLFDMLNLNIWTSETLRHTSVSGSVRTFPQKRTTWTTPTLFLLMSTSLAPIFKINNKNIIRTSSSTHKTMQDRQVFWNGQNDDNEKNDDEASLVLMTIVMITSMDPLLVATQLLADSLSRLRWPKLDHNVRI